MAKELKVKAQTTISNEDVIVKAVQFFTGENWKAQTQSSNIVTFAGRPRGKIGKLLLGVVLAFFGLLISFTGIGAIIGIPMLIVGMVFIIKVRLQLSKFQNLTVTTEPQGAGAELTIVYPEYAQKLTKQFLNLLPSQPQ